MTIRFGLGLFTAQVPASVDRSFAREYAETLELVRLAERVGFDSVWVSEHHGSSDGYLPSLLVLLGAFAAATERVELGTGVILAPLHDPIRLAEDAAVVDQLSDGRLKLGLGIGWREEEFRMLRVPMSERVARLEDTVGILRLAGTGRRSSFEGRAYRYDDVRVTPPAARDGGIPIVLGGYADAAVRRAGRLADGYITDFTAIEQLRASLRLADEGARGADRDPSSLELLLMQNAFVTRSGEDGWPTVRDGVAHQLGAYDAWDDGADTPANDFLEVPPQDDADLRAVTPVGTPAEVIESLRPMLALARERNVHLIVRLHYPGMPLEPAASAVELFAEEVIPALRG